MISIIIPAKNEHDNIEPLIREIFSVIGIDNDSEVIFVDDGSTDNSLNEMRQQPIPSSLGDAR